MKFFFQTVRDIFEEKTLLERIFYTIFLVAIFRAGTYIMLPGIHPAALVKKTTGILAWLDNLLGGSLQSYSLFSLGIYPYISASIIMQFLGLNFPYFQRLKKEGASGRARMNNITRLLTLLIAAVQAFPYIINATYRLSIQIGKYYFVASSVLLIVTGSLLVLWLADQITEKGLGDGTSMIITASIVSKLPHAFAKEFSLRGSKGFLFMVILLTTLGILVLLVINFTQAVRKISLQQARAVSNPYSQYHNRRDYLPLKLNGAGVMPIIMANMISTLPRLIAHVLRNKSEKAAYIAQIMQDAHGWQYNLFLFFLIFITTFLYTAIFISPTDMANALKQRNIFIPGVKPGRPTSNFIESILTRITLPSCFFLAIVAILPAFAVYFGVTKEFASFFGGTSLIIMIGTMISMVERVQANLFNKSYSRLITTGPVISS